MIPPSIWLLEERCEVDPEWKHLSEFHRRTLQDANNDRKLCLRVHGFIGPAHTACHYEVRVVEYRRVEG